MAQSLLFVAFCGFLVALIENFPTYSYAFPWAMNTVLKTRDCNKTFFISYNWPK